MARFYGWDAGRAKWALRDVAAHLALETGQELENNDAHADLERQTRLRPLRHHRGDRAAGVVRCRRPAGQGRAAQGPGRCGQCHRRRRRPGPSRLGCGSRHPDPGGHRADPAVHLPRPQPHRAAKRADGGGGARHPQSAAAQGRRSQAGRPARRQAGVRLRHRGADRRWRWRCATRASCRPARRSAARRSSSSRRPTCRSIRRPAGSRRASRPRSQPAASSCRPSSAWMSAWRGATWRGSPSTACGCRS